MTNLRKLVSEQDFLKFYQWDLRNDDDPDYLLSIFEAHHEEDKEGFYQMLLNIAVSERQRQEQNYLWAKEELGQCDNPDFTSWNLNEAKEIEAIINNRYNYKSKFNFDNHLIKKDYEEILYNFIRADDPEGYLIELEKKYLESNPRLHFELCSAFYQLSETADNEITEIIFEPDKFNHEEKDKRWDSYRYYRHFKKIIDKRKRDEDDSQLVK
jgi:hypothetical protein